MPGRHDVERRALAGRADDRDADAIGAPRREADLRREERLAATLLRAPEQPRPISAAHATGGIRAELLTGIPGDAAGQRFPEGLAFGRADDGRVVEFLVRQQGIVRAAAGRALVLHAVDGRMLCAGKAHDAHEVRERDPESPLAVRIALGAAHAVLGPKRIVH